MTERLHIYEVGLRDGLQNEEAHVSTEDKLRILDALVDAGVTRFETTSFVSPRAVPRMADADALLPAAQERASTRHAALVINDKGYRRAVDAGAREVAIVVVVTESLCQRNNRTDVAEGLRRASALVRTARADELRVRTYVAPAWHCPFEGPVAPDVVFRTAETLAEAGAHELAIADTIGQAHPFEVGERFSELALRLGEATLAAHLHDTTALGLANAVAAIQAGVRTIDASIGGLGGCPFAPGSAGNLATEDLVFAAHRMGFDTGIDLLGLWRAVDVASTAVGRRLGGRTGAFWNGPMRAPTTTRAPEAGRPLQQEGR